ncbi:type IV secretion system protein VirB10 [Roseateles sp. DC23W]|uniref:Type IV secretion system protein VirB10 n=1 Tax=Pelomonas dachongensis TaxID=3299029 RepID=A0ABW7EX55_9BURK
MTVPAQPSQRPDTGAALDGNTLSPLPGEPGIPHIAAAQGTAVSRKGLVALVLLLGALVGLSAFGIQRFAATSKKAEPEVTRAGDKPSAATVEPRRLEAVQQAPAMAASAAPRIPALQSEEDEVARAIGVRPTGTGAPANAGRRPMAPEDAPILLVSSRPTSQQHSRQQGHQAGHGGVAGVEPVGDAEPADALAATSRNLQTYQRQLQGLLNDLTKTADLAEGPSDTRHPSGPLLGIPPAAGPAGQISQPQTNGLFGGQLQGSATPTAAARSLGHRSLTLPKGTAFTCALKTKLISGASGLVGCQVQRHVYSDDGRVLLIERGSHLDGEYRAASVRPGTVRIPVLWTRIRTPLGVTVDIDSPATGPLGESGVGGHVDNRWPERIGAAMLLSLIDDSVKLIVQNQANDSQGDTIVMPSTTANTSKLAEKVLDSTINIPPLLYQNQGGIVGIYVARDVDFSHVYELRPTVR